MNDLTKRQTEILGGVVEEYIRRARPVPSRLLSKRYDLGVCPATIRSELHELVKEGFLDQPHASAGRIPTDKAYRFFVDRLEEEDPVLEEMERVFKNGEEDVWQQLAELTDFLAQASSLFALTALPGKGLFFEEGWDKVLERPEFGERKKTISFARLVKKFKKEVEDKRGGKGRVEVYIGSENPFNGGSFEEFSIIWSGCRIKKEGRGVIISLMGPKRMSYSRNIGLVRSIKKCLEEEKIQNGKKK